MRSLLLRIFLWFWLAMILIAGSTAAITTFIMDEMREQQPRTMQREQRAVANDAARALAKGGREGLTEWLRKRNSGNQGRVYMFTPENQDLLGRELPGRWRRQWETPPQLPGEVPGAPNIRYRPQQSLPAVVGADGTPYRFIVFPARPSRWGVVAEPYTRYVLLIVTLIVTAAPEINSDGIVAWGVRNVIPIILLVVGIGIIASSRKGQMSQNALTVTNVMLGCVVIAGAALFYGFAGDIAGFVFQKQ